MDRKEQIDHRRYEVKELYSKGKTVAEISAILGISKTTGHNDVNWLIKNGKIIKRTKKNSDSKNKSDTNFDKIIKHIGQSIKNKKIQEAVGYAKRYQNSIYLTEEQRTKLKKFIQRVEEIQVKRIVQLMEHDRSPEEIIKITNYSTSFVYATVAKNKEKVKNNQKSNNNNDELKL